MRIQCFSEDGAERTRRESEIGADKEDIDDFIFKDEDIKTESER